jgi:hypothetical protein
MNKKSAGALLLPFLVAGSAIPPYHKTPHVEQECTEPAPTTSTTLGASGGQLAFDNEAFSPPMPWASWMPNFKFPERLVSWPVQLAMMNVEYQSLVGQNPGA